VRTLPEALLERILATPAREAFRFREGNDWRSMSWQEAGARVRAIAGGLKALGIGGEARVALLSGTRVEWVLADLGILCAGGATTTIYPSTLPEDCAFIVGDSGSRVVFAENASQLKKLESVRDKLPQVEKVVVFDRDVGGEAGSGDWVMTLGELEERGRGFSEEEFERTARAIDPSSLATLIYTSGTTGQPKGVELSHDSWAYEGEAVDRLRLLSVDDLQYLWLPLAHSFGKVLEATQLRIGFPTAIDGRVDKIVENLPVLKPTFVAAVPRIFEKVHNRVVLMATEGGAARQALFRWAVSIGREHARRRRAKERMPFTLRLAHALADRLVLSKVRARFGGRLRFFISGSAALSREVAEFFDAAGIVILEGYGLTETSAGSFINRPEDVRFGTVGQPLPGTEVKIAEEDGEILLRGRGVMKGYHGLQQATSEALDGGWLRTGDIGVVSSDGFLTITDRKKDLIKTSGGKYVAPQAIENKLKALCPYVSQVLVHGNDRNFVVALVTLDEDAIKGWAREHGLDGKSLAELAGRDDVKALVQGYVEALNKHLASYESVKKIGILPAEFTLESGEMTPSLKLKRKVIEQKNKALLDSFYGEAVKHL
jgi:long-chain acyl-CoA synthetase